MKGGEFLLVCGVLALLIVVTAATWQAAVSRERANYAHRAKADAVKHHVGDRRLAKLHVIESDPGQVVRLHPKENHHEP